MYLLAPNGTVKTYPYSFGQLLSDNPQVSFPKNPTEQLLASYDVYPVVLTNPPQFDRLTQNLVESTPECVDGVWLQVWTVFAASAEEVAQRKADYLIWLKHMRAVAYREEADPLFFKAQRGEATMEEWASKVQEIKELYPYPEG